MMGQYESRHSDLKHNVGSSSVTMKMVTLYHRGAAVNMYTDFNGVEMTPPQP